MDQTKSLQQIQAESGGASGTAPKMLNIEGIPENVTYALSVIQELLASAPIVSASGDGDMTNSDHMGDDIITEVINCPHNLLGLLIGKNGWTLKRIIRTSGANITINQSVLPNQPKRVIIYGKKENVCIGKALVERVLATSVPATNSRLDQKMHGHGGQHQDFSQQNMNQNHNYDQNMQNPQNNYQNMPQNPNMYQTMPQGHSQSMQHMQSGGNYNGMVNNNNNLNNNGDNYENDSTRKYAKLLQLERDRLRIEKEQNMLQSAMGGEYNHNTGNGGNMHSQGGVMHNANANSNSNQNPMYYQSPKSVEDEHFNFNASSTTLQYNNLSNTGKTISNTDIAVRLKQMQLNNATPLVTPTVTPVTTMAPNKQYIESNMHQIPIPSTSGGVINGVINGGGGVDTARTDRYKAFYDYVQRQNLQKKSIGDIATDFNENIGTNMNVNNVMHGNVVKDTSISSTPRIYEASSREISPNCDDDRPSDCSTIEENVFFNTNNTNIPTVNPNHNPVEQQNISNISPSVISSLEGLEIGIDSPFSM